MSAPNDSNNDEDAMMEEDTPIYNNNNDDEEDFDDTPLFVGEGDAVEVQVDDSQDVPMDDGDDEDDAEGHLLDTRNEAVVEDMAQFTLASHTDPVYVVACSLINSSMLRIVSGGGDDKAYWHEVNFTASTKNIQSTCLDAHYHFKDSVSAVASNTDFIKYVDETTQQPANNPEWVAVGGLDGSVVLFGNNNTVQPLEGPTADIEWLCWHPKGGNVLLVGSSDATIWMYHTTLNKCLQVFVGHEDAVTCGSFSANGKVALSASADGTLRVWAPKTGKSKHVFRFSSSGGSGGGGGGGGGSPSSALTCLATHGGTDQHLVMVGGEDGQAHVCHIANRKHVASLRHYDPTQNTTVASDNDEDEEVVVPSSVEAVGFCKSNPNWCATGGMDGVLKIWDLANQGQCRHSCRVQQQSRTAEQQPTEQTSSTNTNTIRGDGITQLKWHPTIPLVVTSTCRGQVHLWDARNGQLLKTMTGHSDVINDMDVSFVAGAAGAVAGHAVVVTASDDKTVRIFDLDIDAALLAASQPSTQQQ